MPRIAFLLVSLLIASTARAEEPPLPSVALDVRVLEGDFRVISRRTDEDVWAVGSVATDAFTGARSLQVLRSATAGRTWREAPEVADAMKEALLAAGVRYPEVSHLVWLTPETGLAAGYLGERVLRTEDAGRTWRAIPVPSTGWVHDVVHVQGRTWLCGSNWRLLRSEDSGASWKELPGAPFTSDTCASMSFLDREQGWAVGLKGSLWATEDGGDTWRRLQGPPGITNAFQVLRLSPEVGWLDTGGLHQTTDGGRTWHARERWKGSAWPGLHVARMPGGRRVVTVEPVDARTPLAEWLPWLGSAAAVTEDTAVSRLVKDLRVHVAGVEVHAGPFLREGSEKRTPLRGLARKSSRLWLGWVEDRVLASDDEGQRWVERARTQHPIQRIVFAGDGSAFVETREKTLLRSRDDGRTWSPAQGLDARDFAEAVGAPPEPAPYECLRDTVPVALKVTHDYTTCYTRGDSTLYLKVGDEGAVLSGRNDALEGRLQVSPRRLSRGEGEQLIRELLAAAERPETPPTCVDSTVQHRVMLEWACSDAATARGAMSFTVFTCGEDPETAGRVENGTYSRAHGVRWAAIRALRSAMRHSPQPGPGR